MDLSKQIVVVDKIVQDVLNAVADTKTTDAEKVFLLKDIAKSVESFANSREKLLAAMPPAGQAELVEYLSYILELNENQVKEIIGVYHDHARDIAMG